MFTNLCSILHYISLFQIKVCLKIAAAEWNQKVEVTKPRALLFHRHCRESTGSFKEPFCPFWRGNMDDLCVNRFGMGRVEKEGRMAFCKPGRRRSSHLIMPAWIFHLDARVTGYYCPQANILSSNKAVSEECLLYKLNNKKTILGSRVQQQPVRSVWLPRNEQLPERVCSE